MVCVCGLELLCFLLCVMSFPVVVLLCCGLLLCIGLLFVFIVSVGCACLMLVSMVYSSRLVCACVNAIALLLYYFR